MRYLYFINWTEWTTECGEVSVNFRFMHSIYYITACLYYKLSVKRNLSLFQSDIHWNPLHQNDSYLDTD